MSVRLVETAESRAFTLNERDSQAVFKYVAFITGETNPEDALYDRLAQSDHLTTNITPYIWNGLIKLSPSATPLGGGFYTAELLYGLPQGGDAYDPGVSPPPGAPPPPPPAPPAPADNDALTTGSAFEISGEPQRITHSIFTLSRTGRAGIVPATETNHQGAINVEDGKPEGVEIIVPYMTLSLTKRFQFLSYGYLKTLRELVGQTNLDTFFGYAADEVLFLGASGSVDKDQGVTVQYKFGVRKTETDVIVRAGEAAGLNEIKVPTKPGWYHLWVEFGEELDATSGKLAVRPQAAYVERIYKHTSFAPLQIS